MPSIGAWASEPHGAKRQAPWRQAVGLILGASASTIANGVFVLDMGEPVRIGDLARDMIRLSGLKPGIDIAIEYAGLRPGEKLYEELFYGSERPLATDNPKLLLAESEDILPGRVLEAGIRDMEEAAARDDVPAVLRILRHLVPGYRPFDEQGANAALASG